ncbi:hypothetical protein P153DRAFT_342540 [Dothidotthia symphoricarpi CBS 119687]|uniref:Pre-rRNA-processing protein RIX1 n=1 Tax=Dothidotthia symphoricarpi CBS 119687 TaxID=1392245 RepID=A0A6A6A9I5_9PLEO|nr:uncharacterized protein P153DRAFT_342540 [Dothidotthia symphoricarpi CBS 119687]KAF2128622.1 hypothetical protein P153DRAFT_342540 [Dothidotthia symphoricarpi CBS 119687]
MAPAATELATLRALTFRISSTATAQLPQHVPAIAASLANCRTLLSSAQTSGSKASSSEASVAVHKYRTLLSTLLQDRTVQGRWSAIVLIKATVEVGGWETLQKCLPWVRGLLGILVKPDPPSSKKLCLITLTRIFLLTREYPTIIREITTPSLPTFVQTSLKIASLNAPAGLLLVILESFNELLPRHPTIFRSYLKQLHPFLARLIAPTPSSKLSKEQDQDQKFEITSEITTAARRLFVQLPNCAPKGASSEDWAKSLKTTVNNAHRVADKVFRAVLEDWQPTTREAPSVNGHTLNDEVQDLEVDSMALPPWSGIFAGSERLTNLLWLVKEYLDNSTANPVYFNVGVIMDLVTRMLSLTVPASGGKAFQNAVRFNNQTSKEERENLWLVLPSIHVATFEVLLALTSRSQSSTLALDALILDQLVWVFGSEKESAQIRTACYSAASVLLKRSGVTLPKSSTDSLAPLIRACCEDLLPSEVIAGPAKQTPGEAKANGHSQPQAIANADSFLGASRGIKDPFANFTGLKEAAYNLLPLLLANIRAQYLSDSLRARLDRTAILTQHKDAMVASVLNPPPSKKFGKPAASILPLMARSFPQDQDVEGMLRPRVPVIRVGHQDTDLDDEMEDEAEEEDGEDEEEEEEEEEEAEEKELEEEQEVPDKVDEHFVGQELDTLLESAGQPSTAATDHTMSEAPADEEVISQTKATSDIPEPATPQDIGKRPHAADAPLSPAKRVRTSERVRQREEAQRTSYPILPATTPTKPPVVPATSDFTATTTASVIPELPEPGEAGDSDDDEDVVPLVFGQDTDDESE